MTDLTPICALGGAQAQVQRFGSLTLAENDGLALASLAGATGASPFGLDLPGPGRCCAGDGVAAFWTGPDQWMIEAPDKAVHDFAAAVKAQAPNALVSEQTDAWVAFEITSCDGAAPVLALLEKLANIDLESFGPGAATRTGLHHMNVFVIRRAEDRLAVIGMRSLADTLWHALAETAERLENET